jgi:ABC-type phosphonate transport system ATPase subunit
MRPMCVSAALQQRLLIAKQLVNIPQVARYRGLLTTAITSRPLPSIHQAMSTQVGLSQAVSLLENTIAAALSSGMRIMGQPFAGLLLTLPEMCLLVGIIQGHIQLESITVAGH